MPAPARSQASVRLNDLRGFDRRSERTAALRLNGRELRVETDTRHATCFRWLDSYLFRKFLGSLRARSVRRNEQRPASGIMTRPGAGRRWPRQQLSGGVLPTYGGLFVRF